MNNFSNFISEINQITNNTKVKYKNELISIDKGFKILKKMIVKSNSKNFFIGNGGSNSNCSHMVNDFNNVLKIPSISLSDLSLLTCLSNDIGYANTYSSFLKVNFNKYDNLIILSSSGESENLKNAIKFANNFNQRTISFTSFNDKNFINKKSTLCFYTNTSHYSKSEISHLILLHYFVDNYEKY